MDTFLNVLVTGTVSGAVLALVSVGFVCLYRATGVFSLANGYFMTLGAMLFYEMWHVGHVQFAASMVFAVAGMSVLGAMLFYGMFARLQGRDTFIASVATLGVGLVIQAVTFLVWGSTIYTVEAPFVTTSWHITPAVAVTATDLIICGMALVLAGAVGLVAKFTRPGREMRAVAENAQLAAYWGVKIRRVAATGWALAAGAAAVAGVMYALGASIDVGQMPSIGLVAIPAIFLGGLDSLLGALVGGLAIGLLQALSLVWLGGQWEDAFAYAALLVMIAIKPEGLFGSRTTVRL